MLPSRDTSNFYLRRLISILIDNPSRNHPIKVDGHSLTTAEIVAAARHLASVHLDERREIRQAVEKSRQIIVDKVASGASIYGLSTGFGGSGTFLFLFFLFLIFIIFLQADSRTDQPLKLGDSLLQHQHIGILPTNDLPPEILPLQDPSQSTTMPEAWVRLVLLQFQILFYVVYFRTEQPL